MTSNNVGGASQSVFGDGNLSLPRMWVNLRIFAFYRYLTSLLTVVTYRSVFVRLLAVDNHSCLLLFFLLEEGGGI